MCLLSVYEPGVMPDPEHLENGARLNPIGHGFAIAHAGRIIASRGLAARPVLRRFLRLRALYPHGHALFHSRQADAQPTLAGCHPYRVGGDPHAVMAHNGYLWHAPEGDPRSDTEMLAADILPAWDVHDESQRASLEQHLGRNKAVILHASKGAVILNEGLGIRLNDGTWHSNLDYTGVGHMVPGACAVCQRDSAIVVCDDCRAEGDARLGALRQASRLQCGRQAAVHRRMDYGRARRSESDPITERETA